MSENKKARETILQIVENQISANDPPLVNITLDRLINSGFSRPEAIGHIASALVIELNGALAHSEPFNSNRYDYNLRQLPNIDWDGE